MKRLLIILLCLLAGPAQAGFPGSGKYAGGNPVSGWTFFTASTKAGTCLLGSPHELSNNTGADCAVYSVSYRSAGKYYFEYAWTSSGTNAEAGLATAAIAGTAVSLRNTPNGVGNDIPSGTVIVYNTVTIGNTDAVTSAQDFAIDLDHGKYWERHQGGTWNNNGAANPATNTGGLDISGLLAQGPVAPAVFLQGAAANANATSFNFGTFGFNDTPPAGFDLGWPQ